MTRSPVWHPFTQHGLGEPIPLITNAEGAAIFTSDGERIIDAISSWWVITHGHCHHDIVDAIRQQAGTLDQLVFAGWTHGPAEKLAQALVDLTPPALTRVFFSDSGSTSVEVAIKMALGYWALRGEKRHRIVVMEYSYHGDTIGAMSVGARGVFNQRYAPLLFDVSRIPFPASDAVQATYDALEAACRTDPRPAAFIVEPLVLGAGGMLCYSPAVLAEMHAICARHGVLFIADEVMTGWGRTGTMFACDQAAIVPDLLCVSKGLTGGALPLAATLAREDIFEAHSSRDRADAFFHSSSYTANPIACAAANANIGIWQREPVVERIAALAERQRTQLSRFASHPKVRETRQAGTIGVVELATPTDGYLSDIAPRLAAYFRERGVLLRALGNIVYTMPPYCITPLDLTRIYDILEAAIEDIV